MDADETVKVRYSCHDCGISGREVTVRARAAAENVIEWMESVCVVALCADHAKMSPHCHPSDLKDVLIPIPQTGKIGGVTHQ